MTREHGVSHVHVALAEAHDTLVYDQTIDPSGTIAVTETITELGSFDWQLVAVQRAGGSADLAFLLQTAGRHTVEAYSSDGGTTFTGRADGVAFGPATQDQLPPAVERALEAHHGPPAPGHDHDDPTQIASVIQSLTNELASARASCSAPSVENTVPPGDPPAHSPVVEFTPNASPPGINGVSASASGACTSVVDGAGTAELACVAGTGLTFIGCAAICSASGPGAGFCILGCAIGTAIQLAVCLVSAGVAIGAANANGGPCCPQECPGGGGSSEVCCLSSSTCVSAGGQEACCDVPCGPDPTTGNPLCCDAGAACFRDPADLTALDCCPMGDRLCPLPGAAGAVPTANCCAMATVCTSSGDCVPPDRACPTSGGPVVACPVGTTCDVATGACCPAGATLCETAAGGAGAGACCAAGETCNPATGACCATGTHPFPDGQCCAVECGSACCAAGGACDPTGTRCVYDCSGVACTQAGACNQSVPANAGLPPACCPNSFANNVGGPCAGEPMSRPSPIMGAPPVPAGCCTPGEVCPSNTNPSAVPGCCGLAQVCPNHVQVSANSRCCQGDTVCASDDNALLMPCCCAPGLLDCNGQCCPPTAGGACPNDTAGCTTCGQPL